MEALNLEIHEPLSIIINGEIYRLEWPFKNLPNLEKRINRPMRQAFDWFLIKREEYRDVIAVGLLQNHSEEDTEELAASVAEVLENDVEASSLFHEQVLQSTWPRAKSKAEEAMREIFEMQKQGIDPKAQSADAR